MRCTGEGCSCKQHAVAAVPCDCFSCGNGPEGSEVWCKRKEAQKELVPSMMFPLDFTGAVRELEEKARNYVASNPSKRADLLQRHEELCSYARKIMEKKNQDYGANDDPFRNFREFGTYGILVRLSDKLARIRTWEEKGQFAVDETLQDTVLDAINYLILYLTMKERG